VVAATVALPNSNPTEAAGPDEAPKTPELAGVGALPNREGALLAGVGVPPNRVGGPVLAGVAVLPKREAPLLAAAVAAVDPNREPAELQLVGLQRL
jgi:hypothetical protein